MARDEDHPLPEVDSVVRRGGHTGPVRGPQDVRPGEAAPPGSPWSSGSPGSSGSLGSSGGRAGGGRAPRGRRRPDRRTRGGLAVAAAALVGVAYVAADSSGASQSQTIDAPGAVELDVRGVDDLRIVSGDPGRLRVEVDERLFGRCDPLAASVADGRLTGSLDCGDAPLGGADASITVPAGAPLTLRVDDTDVDVSGRFAALRVDSQDGDVRLRGVDGPTAVTTVDGDVTGSVASGAGLDVNTDDGDVELDDLGSVGATTIRSSGGDVELEARRGPYRLDLFGDDVESDIVSDPGAARSIAVRTGDDVRLRD